MRVGFPYIIHDDIHVGPARYGIGWNRLMAYNVKKLHYRHHEIARLLLLGWGNKQIAEALSVTPQHVSDMRKDPLLQRRMTVLTERRDVDAVNVEKRLKEEAPASLDTLLEVRDDVDSGRSLRARVALELLDRAGHGKMQRVQANILHGAVPPEVMARVKQRMDRARSMEDIPDAVFEEIPENAESTLSEEKE